MPLSKLRVPPSASTVNVRVIDSTSKIRVSMESMVSHVIKGHSWLSCPSYVFLVEHPPTGRKVLFDLGVRKDFENLSPPIQNWMKESGTTCSVEKDVREILEEGGVKAGEIESIIWSHWHWDHIGDPSRFPTSTSLIVGPGFKDIIMPGYPTKPGSPVLDSDFAGRELRELSFAKSTIKVGSFPAIDYFGDGSFYILDAPGHTVGHVNAIARVTTGPDSFILMGGDTCHHSAEMRPSAYNPLPDSISPHPFHSGNVTPCPGALFKPILRDEDTTKPFYGVHRPGMLFGNPDAAEETVERIIEADGSGNTLVVIAHDTHLKDIVREFPEYANDFLTRGWIEQGRWLFLEDFKEAVDGVYNEKL
ncbi:metallo-beta-lactamase superfamily protein [Colletotrichum limetticola]|uniref:Metallo-beta-lactamase superfamily protein n=1 Tax=Colletotrichum limetticola TaxID=1209924 RepID=A0ABQ9P8C7_9PEZI|nr:metallo-beta-lactamase superfamily protein [Colletotrichum limetticola]